MEIYNNILNSVILAFLGTFSALLASFFFFSIQFLSFAEYTTENKATEKTVMFF